MAYLVQLRDYLGGIEKWGLKVLKLISLEEVLYG